MQNKQFGKWRSILWPIYKHEVPKLVPMFLIFFLISFIYNLLRPVKQSIVLSSPEAGGEIISYLKVWAVLPIAFIFTFIFAHLSNRFHREQVFYIIITIFVSFFVLFSFYLYPNLASLSLNNVLFDLHSFKLISFNVIGNTLAEPYMLNSKWQLLISFQDKTYTTLAAVHNIAQGFNGALLMLKHWPLTLFYAMCEVWGAVVLSLLFWGFANEVTKMNDAKRFYALFSFSSNSSGMLSGYASVVVSGMVFNNVLGSVTHWEQTLNIFTIIVLITSLIICLLFRWVNVSQGFSKDAFTKPVLEAQDRLSLFECMRYVFKFRYLTYLAIIIVSYNVVFHLTDVLWSDAAKQCFGSDKNAFTAYNGKITGVTSFLSSIIDLFITGTMLRNFGWTVTAVATPVVLLVTGIFFYGTEIMNITFADLPQVIYIIMGSPSTTLILLLGSIQICTTRSLKYTLFDASKEIAYIPLSKEGRRKGKAAIDVVASRFGKSGGAVLVQFLVLILSSTAAATPYIVGLIVLMTIGWVITVKALGKEVEVLAADHIKNAEA